MRPDEQKRDDPMKTTIKTAALAGMMLLAWPGTAQACERCFGAGGAAEGITLAMLALVAMTGVVFGGIGAFFLNVRRRTRQRAPGTLVVSQAGDLQASTDALKKENG